MSRQQSDFDKLLGKKRHRFVKLRIARMSLNWSTREFKSSLPLVIGATILLAFVTLKIYLSPWNVGLTLRHWAAAPNCAAARSMGLDMARPSEPGYYLRHDRDRDGIACEPYPK